MRSERTQHLRPTALTLWELPWSTLLLELDCLAPVKRFLNRLACKWRFSAVLIMVHHLYDLNSADGLWILYLLITISHIRSLVTLELLWTFGQLTSPRLQRTLHKRPFRFQRKIKSCKTNPCFVTNLKKSKCTWICHSFDCKEMKQNYTV